MTNAAGASISGVVGVDAAGIFTTGGTATITNKGQINGSHYGILVAAGGSVTNSSSGTIQGQGSGVSLSHGGTLSNSGAISSTAANSAAADLELGGSLNNKAGGSIVGAAYGAFITGAQGTVVNAGTITGAAFYGVALNDGGSIHNAATGSIIGQSAGVSLANQSATVVNDGSISATGSGGAAITISAGGTVTNDSGATLSAAAFGVFASGVAAKVTNAGQISGADAVGFEAGGTSPTCPAEPCRDRPLAYLTPAVPASLRTPDRSRERVGRGGPRSRERRQPRDEQCGRNHQRRSLRGLHHWRIRAIVSNAASASISSGGTGVYMGGGSDSLTNGGTITSTGTAGVDAEGAGNVVTNASGGPSPAVGPASISAEPGTVKNLGLHFRRQLRRRLRRQQQRQPPSGRRGRDLHRQRQWRRRRDRTVERGGRDQRDQQFRSILGVPVAQCRRRRELGDQTGSGNAIANVTDNGALTVDGSLDVTSALNAASTGAFDLGAGGVLELAAATGSQTAMDFQGASQLVVDNAALFGTGVGGTSYSRLAAREFWRGRLGRPSQFLRFGSDACL